MQLDAAKSEADRAVELFFKIRIIGMDGGKCRHAVVAPNDLRHEIRDRFSLLRRDCGRADEKMGNAGSFSVCQQIRDGSRRAVAHVVKASDGFGDLFCDFIGKNMRVSVYDFHFALPSFSKISGIGF